MQSGSWGELPMRMLRRIPLDALTATKLGKASCAGPTLLVPFCVSCAASDVQHLVHSARYCTCQVTPPTFHVLLLVWPLTSILLQNAVLREFTCRFAGKRSREAAHSDDPVAQLAEFDNRLSTLLCGWSIESERGQWTNALSIS